MKTVLLKIWNDKLSDYPILDYTFKFWVYGLLTMWVLGMGGLLYGIISGEADISNASFGIFDHI
jgi:hypothetical protein